MRKYILIGVGILLAGGALYMNQKPQQLTSSKQPLAMEAMSTSSPYKTAVFAGGCFWSVQKDFEKIPSGILGVVSGYTGGSSENPTYSDYTAGGHREAVQITYDPTKVSYKDLAQYLIQHIDPTDAGGSFYDRGPEYTSAIYYENDEEKKLAENVVSSITKENVFTKPIVTAIVPREKFWPAEEYHQDYAKKNPVQYGLYRAATGRDTFVENAWKGRDITIHHTTTMNEDNTTANNASPSANDPWKHFTKPSEDELKAKLTPMQYTVTQKEGTEAPFQNEYADNHADGIYVDIVSGEPLYSSKDKYDSGTGWPSFVKPISPDDITTRTDNGLFASRTEVRSKIADSHLGHVFNDGPTDRGGMRYCMNSAAMRFIPKEDLVKEGYGEFAHLFE